MLGCLQFARIICGMNSMEELYSQNPGSVRILSLLDVAQSSLFILKTRNWSPDMLKMFTGKSFPPL